MILIKGLDCNHPLFHPEETDACWVNHDQLPYSREKLTPYAQKTDKLRHMHLKLTFLHSFHFSSCECREIEQAFKSPEKNKINTGIIFTIADDSLLGLRRERERIKDSQKEENVSD